MTTAPQAFSGLRQARARCRQLLVAALLSALVAPLAHGDGLADHAARFRHLTVEDGLSQETVNAIVQDHQGFVWLGTQNGLNRYDGRRFRTYVHDRADPHSLPGSWIWTLAVDSRGDIWVGTINSGLARYDQATDRFVRYPDAGKRIRSIAEAADGMIWVGSEGLGATRIDPVTGASQRFHTGNSALRSNAVRALHVDSFGTLWAGTSPGGVYRHDAALDRFVRADMLSANVDVRAIAGGGDGPLWMATADRGLLGLDPASGEPVAAPAALASQTLRLVFIDRDGHLWVGHDTAGLQRLDRHGRLVTHRHDPGRVSSLIDDHVTALFQDRNGLVWVGTQRGVGLWDARGMPFVNFAKQPDPARSLSENWVGGFATHDQRRFWVATYGGGVNLVDVDQRNVEVLRHDPADSNSLSDDRVMALAQDRQGHLWAGTLTAGLNRYEPVTGRWTRYRHDPTTPGSLTSDAVTSLLEDRLGHLWVGTHGGGINRFDATLQRFEQLGTGAEGDACHHQILSIFEDRAGKLWFGTHGGGLCAYDPATGRMQRWSYDASVPSGLSSGNAWLVSEDAAGHLWIATSNAGLSVWLAEDRARGVFELRHFGVAHGLPSQVVYGLLPDAQGRMWISSDRGLARLSLVVDGPHARLEDVRRFTRDDGLLGNEFNFAAAYRNGFGRLLFGGTMGFTVLRPQLDDAPAQAPDVVLTETRTLNVPTAFDRAAPSVALRHDDTIVTFEYAALDFSSPGQIRYQHWLEGFDNTWVDDGNLSRATYTNLEPGEYLFKVRAATRHGAWGDVTLSVPLTVASAPWATGWAYSLYALAVALGLLLLVRAWHRRGQRAEAMARMNASLRAEMEARQAKTVELRQEKARAQGYLDVVEVVILALDPHGRVRMVNQKGMRLLATDEDDIVGRDFCRDFVPEDERDIMSKVLDDVDAYSYTETRLQPRVGHERLIAWHTIRLPDDPEGEGGWLLSGSDVTQMRKLESQLRDAQKMEALGTLARGVAHDFNNILGAILGYQELAKRSVGNDADALDYLTKSESAVERAKEIVHRVLTFGRVANMTPVPTNFSQAVGEAMQLVRPGIPEGVRLVEDIEPDCGPVLADAAQISQIVLNLCTNACQSMSEGGGTLEVHAFHWQVDTQTARESRTLQPGLHVRLVVADTGPGMDEYTRSRIYEPFFTTRMEGEGTGLGLSVVHGIVTSLKGVIDVQSQVGRGTRFEVTLPCYAEFRPVVVDEQTVSARETLDDDLDGSETILFVDDEPEVAQIAMEGLTQLGYTVLTAGNGEDALNLVRSNSTRIDILITDQSMPGMLGEQIAAEAKRARPGLPVLLVSGADVEPQSDVDGFLSKPYTQASLVAKIRTLLSSREAG